MEARAEDKAAFCLVTGVQPSEYEALTTVEVEAFIRMAKKRNSK